MSQGISTEDRKQLTRDYLRRLENLEQQERTLREDKKELREEFKEALDLKALHKALRIKKIQESIEDKDMTSFDECLHEIGLLLDRAESERAAKNRQLNAV